MAQESLDEIAHGIAHGIAAASGVPAVAHRRAGQAMEELGAYSADEGIDLIVVATHGWGGLQRAWLGSVADGLIREARVPVVAFRPEEEAETEVLTDPQPAKAILDYAAQVGAELITLATRGRSWLARFALGSVADKVLRGADTPVMVLRPEGADAEEGAEAEERANLGEDLVGA